MFPTCLPLPPFAGDTLHPLANSHVSSLATTTRRNVDVGSDSDVGISFICLFCCWCCLSAFGWFVWSDAFADKAVPLHSPPHHLPFSTYPPNTPCEGSTAQQLQRDAIRRHGETAAISEWGGGEQRLSIGINYRLSINNHCIERETID